MCCGIKEYIIPIYNHATFLSYYHEHLRILTFTSGIAREWLKKVSF